MVPEDSLVVRDHSKVYFFGGRAKPKTLPMFDIEKRQWMELPPLKAMYMVTGTTVLPYKNRFIMFGGEVPIEHARIKTLTSKIFEIDFKVGTMEELDSGGSTQQLTKSNS